MSNNTPEPPPTASTSRPTWELVIADMQERHKAGVRKYGLPLQPFNGRDNIVGAYQEVLDLAVYLRNEIEERRSAIQMRRVLLNLRDHSRLQLTGKELEMIEEALNGPS